MPVSVLIVDDEPKVRRSLRRLLERAGYRVTETGCGEQALLLMENEPCDLVLTDFRMPGMNGSELLNAVHSRWPESVGMVLSGFTDYQLLVDMINNGYAFKFANKPWRENELLEMVSKASDEVAARRCNRLFTRLLMSGSDPLFELGSDLRLIRYNAAAEETLKLSRFTDADVYLAELFPDAPMTMLSKLVSGEIALLHVVSQDGEIGELNTRERGKGQYLMQFSGLLKSSDPVRHIPDTSALLDKSLMLQEVESYVNECKRDFALVVLAIEQFQQMITPLPLSEVTRLVEFLVSEMALVLPERVKIAHIYHNKFALLIPPNTSEVALQHILLALVSHFEEPVQFMGLSNRIQCRIGYVMAPADGNEANQLLSQAMHACIQNKGNGTRFFMRFCPRMLDDRQRQFAISSALHHCVERDELSLVFQPKVNLKSGLVESAEALMRWTHPSLGIISPGVFIPIAERDGQILELGTWLIDRACAELNQWQQNGRHGLGISINLSGRQLLESDLVQQLIQVSRRHGLAPRGITLEITETYFMQNMERSLLVIEQLADAGFKISLDDFGTGYSSLAYLDQLPVSEIKLDRSMVSKVTHSSKAQSMLRNIIRMAGELKIRTIAEGVESEEQYLLLAELGCEVIQGFYFSKPLTGEEFVTIVREQPYTTWIQGAVNA